MLCFLGNIGFGEIILVLLVLVLFILLLKWLMN